MRRQPQTLIEGKPVLPPQIANGKVVNHHKVPWQYADGYALAINGEWLSPVLENQDRIVLSPSAPILAGIMVLIFFRNRHLSVLRLVSLPSPNGTLTAEQLNPPAEYSVDAADVETIHAVVGRIRNGVWSELEAARALN